MIDMHHQHESLLLCTILCNYLGTAFCHNVHPSHAHRLSDFSQQKMTSQRDVISCVLGFIKFVRSVKR
nr:MAG TPA: hypothetical protein [Caudoviricetes sp.]